MERPWFLRTWIDPPPPGHGAPWGLVLGWGGSLLAVVLALHAWWLLSVAPGLHRGSRVVDIPPQLGIVEVARRLDEAGVIRSPLGFALLAALRGTARSLRAGEYEIPQGANAFAVLALLEGGRVRQHAVLMPEGATVATLARVLEEAGLAPSRDILRLAGDSVFLRALGVEAPSVEGYLFPDTYQFVKGMTPEDMLARMVARMRDRVSPEILAEADSRGLGLHQLLTLASIIEREAVERREMPLISAVFWNRLRREMPLQADPTVQYAVGKDGRALTREDLQVDSPFNTYRRLGLPPGPIGSPGRAAIEAAVRPARVDYLYFVAMNEREHRFSSNLADHNAAVAKYRLFRSR